MAVTVVCRECGWCTDFEITSETNPAHCPECYGLLMIGANGEITDDPYWVDGDVNPILLRDEIVDAACEAARRVLDELER